MILTCSQDRNAYVWSPPSPANNNEWSPQIVLLRFDRAATCCAWSPNGKKFIVGGAEKNVMICYYDEKNDFWVAKKINRHTSAILSLAWHPSGVMMGSSGCDSKAILGAALQTKAGDSKTSIDVFGEVKDCASGSVFHKEVVTGSWISCVAFSPNGLIMALCSRNSTVRFIRFESVDEEKTAEEKKKKEEIRAKKEEGKEEGKADRSNPKVMNVKRCTVLLRTLPFSCGLFIDDSTFIGAGYDSKPCKIVLKSAGDFEWAVDKDLTLEEVVQEKKAGASSLAATAMRRFQAQTMTGKTDASSGTDSADEKVEGHANSVTSLKIAKIEGGKVTHVSTTGLDGRFLFWKVN